MIVEIYHSNLNVKLDVLSNHFLKTTLKDGGGIYTIVTIRSKNKFDVIHNFKSNLLADNSPLNDFIRKALVDASELFI